jgi:surfactin synthase thioesterase subunit
MTSPHRPEGDRVTWLRVFHPAQPSSPGPVRRLVCFPYAGGSAGAYYTLSKALVPAIQVEAVQYPGRQDRVHERPAEDLRALADTIAGHLVPGPRPAPVFFGHSLGALLAYETARSMVRIHGSGPARLIVSGMAAPTRVPAVHMGSDSAVLGDLARQRGIDPGVLDDPELQDMILPALRSDHRALASYTADPHAGVPCPITVFTGADDPLVDADAARAWADHTRHPLGLRVFPGGHFYLDGFPPEVTAAVKAETFLA